MEVEPSLPEAVPKPPIGGQSHVEKEEVCDRAFQSSKEPIEMAQPSDVKREEREPRRRKSNSAVPDVHIDVADTTPSPTPPPRQPLQQTPPTPSMAESAGPPSERVASLPISIPLSLVKLSFTKVTEVGRRVTRSSRSRTPGGKLISDWSHILATGVTV